MALSDIYQIKHTGLFLGEPGLNVYHVERTDPGFDATDMTLAFQDSIVPSLKACQSLQYLYQEITAQNLGDPTDFDTRSMLGQTGEHTGTAANSSLAFSIRFPRQRTDMRDGFKRWGGMTETQYSFNDTLGPFQGLMSTLGNALVVPWEIAAAPGVPVCNYIIVKRVCTVQPPPSPCPSYRLPELGDTLVFYKPLTSLFKVPVRTQVSRRVTA